ncbi:MAG TPA: primosomal protein DnaI [Bacilli bacterium]
MKSLAEILKQFPAAAYAGNMEQKIAQILNAPEVKKLRAQYPELDEQILLRNINKLYQYVTEYRNCANCPGVDQCPNEFPGHYTRLSVELVNGEPQLVERKVACKKWLAHQAREAVRKRVRSFYVDERALDEGCNIEEIVEIDRDRAEAVGKIISYMIATRDNGLQPKGLFLTGGFGTGKTFLMCYMLHELAKSGYSGVIVYTPEFVEDLKSMFSEPQKLKETVELMKQCDLLVFDDIGAENLNPWVRDHVIGSILNYRMNRKPTFYTSNFNLELLEQHFSFTNKEGEEEYKGRRLMDRIRPYVDVIEVAGTNKRGNV